MADFKIKRVKSGALNSCNIFSYLNVEEKEEIFTRLEKGQSEIYLVLDEKEYVIFGFILDFNEKLHVREVAGKFLKNVYILDTFSEAIARIKGYEKITVNTTKKAVAKVAEKIGFKLNEYNEYERLVNGRR